MTHGRSRSQAQDARIESTLLPAVPAEVGSPARRTLSLRTLAGAGLVTWLAIGMTAACAAGGNTTSQSSGTTGTGTTTGMTTGGGGDTTTTTGAGGKGGGSTTSTTTSTTGAGGMGGGGTTSTTAGNGGNGGNGGNVSTGGGGAGGIGGSGTTTATTTSTGCVSVPEMCNGLDDDCDGMIDNGDPGGGADCMANGVFGVCKLGVQHCNNGSLKCVPGQAQPETCNGLDDNCDSFVDEGIIPGVGMQCDTGMQGLCATGLTTCNGMAGISCTASVMPNQLMESCNGQDDNCDGLVDVGIPQIGQPCNAAGFVGICQFGTFDCPAQAPFQLTCNHPAPGTVQESCNGKDDDCNGTIDDPALLNGQPCNTGLPGVCAAGTSQCAGGSGTCNAMVAPGTQQEICNNKDDNCNNVVDDIPNVNAACAGQLPNAAHVQNWACGMANCNIAMCGPGYADIDGASSNGCECSTDAYAQACASAGTISVPIGAMNTTMSGVVESANGSDFAVFSFADKPVGSNWHPKVQLTNSAGGQYKMDVLTSCGVAAACNNNGTGNNADVWEATYGSVAPGTYEPGDGCCSDNTAHQTSVIVRISRKFGDAPTCAPYTVTASNP